MYFIYNIIWHNIYHIYIIYYIIYSVLCAIHICSIIVLCIYNSTLCATLYSIYMYRPSMLNCIVYTRIVHSMLYCILYSMLYYIVYTRIIYYILYYRYSMLYCIVYMYSA